MGFDSTLACLGAVESAFSATAAKPVMNMILMSGSSSAALRASSMPSISGITMSVSSNWNGSSQPLIGRQAVVVGDDLEAGVLQRLHQKAPHVAVIFGKKDFRVLFALRAL